MLFTALGKDPWQAFHVFFIKPVETRYGVGELLLKAGPLMLCAIGLAAGYPRQRLEHRRRGPAHDGRDRRRRLALLFHDSTSPLLLLPAMIVAGALGGMAWAAIPAFLRTRFNANEILVSLMLVYVATFTLSLLVHGPWRDPEGFNFPQSQDVRVGRAAAEPARGDAAQCRLPDRARRPSPSAGCSWSKSLVGFQMRVAGLAPAAANYAGISARRTIWIGMLIGGACAGIAGVGEAAGPIGQLLPSISPGYGFAAIIVAFVGRLHPVGILFASLLMSLLYLGGESAQMGLALPSAVTGLFQGTLLFFLFAADVFVNYRLRRARAPGRGA